MLGYGIDPTDIWIIIGQIVVYLLKEVIILLENGPYLG